jgi:hypothetical protein
LEKPFDGGLEIFLQRRQRQFPARPPCLEIRQAGENHLTGPGAYSLLNGKRRAQRIQIMDCPALI